MEYSIALGWRAVVGPMQHITISCKANFCHFTHNDDRWDGSEFCRKNDIVGFCEQFVDLHGIVHKIIELFIMFLNVTNLKVYKINQ